MTSCKIYCGVDVSSARYKLTQEDIFKQILLNQAIKNIFFGVYDDEKTSCIDNMFVVVDIAVSDGIC